MPPIPPSSRRRAASPFALAALSALALAGPAAAQVEPGPAAGQPPVVAAEPEIAPDLVRGGVESGLERSPDDWVAVLLEITGPRECESDEAGLEICSQETRILDLFASADGRHARGSVLRLVGNGQPRSKFLVFAVPIDDGSEIYGATFGTALTLDRHRRAFAEALDAALAELRPER